MEFEGKTVLRGLWHPVRSLAEALDDMIADLVAELDDPRTLLFLRNEINTRLERLKAAA
jgi:hypothetical protein